MVFLSSYIRVNMNLFKVFHGIEVIRIVIDLFKEHQRFFGCTLNKEMKAEQNIYFLFM